jgi:hypothetical protein
MYGYNCVVGRVQGDSIADANPRVSDSVDSRIQTVVANLRSDTQLLAQNAARQFPQLSKLSAKTFSFAGCTVACAENRQSVTGSGKKAKKDP